MKIILAKTSGFCFGVERAINTVMQLKENSDAMTQIFTLGPIIHNPQVVKKLERLQIHPINEHQIDVLSPHDVIVIRSHGISQQVYQKLCDKQLTIIDTTCPFVKNVHRKVEKLEAEHYDIIIIGKADHPEVEGIIGHCHHSPIIINSVAEIDKIEKIPERIGVVEQTTTIQDQVKEIIGVLALRSKEMLVYNTICQATEERQTEALLLTQQVDRMIVVGGKNSSNTTRLYQICLQSGKPVVMVESADELDIETFMATDIIGITGGASTHKESIQAVINKLKENFTSETQIFH